MYQPKSSKSKKSKKKKEKRRSHLSAHAPPPHPAVPTGSDVIPTSFGEESASAEIDDVDPDLSADPTASFQVFA